MPTPKPTAQKHTEAALRAAFAAYVERDYGTDPNRAWARSATEAWVSTARPATLLRRFTSKGGFNDIAAGTTVLAGKHPTDERFNEEGYVTMWTVGSRCCSMVAERDVRFL